MLVYIRSIHSVSSNASTLTAMGRKKANAADSTSNWTDQHLEIYGLEHRWDVKALKDIRRAKVRDRPIATDLRIGLSAFDPVQLERMDETEIYQRLRHFEHKVVHSKGNEEITIHNLLEFSDLYTSLMMLQPPPDVKSLASRRGRRSKTGQKASKLKEMMSELSNLNIADTVGTVVAALSPKKKTSGRDKGKATATQSPETSSISSGRFRSGTETSSDETPELDNYNMNTKEVEIGEQAVAVLIHDFIRLVTRRQSLLWAKGSAASNSSEGGSSSHQGGNNAVDPGTRFRTV